MSRNTYVADIYFHDEAPRLGCGWRRIEVTVGRKWLKLRDRQGVIAWLPLHLLSILKPRKVDV